MTYLQAVLAGDRRAALRVTLDALASGMSVSDVYIDVLQPAQHEIGRMWASNEITVAREHTATAITQYVIAQLYDRMPVPESASFRGNALVTGVEGELHQVGANMVADVLQADGWRMRFLGTHLPNLDILNAIEEYEPLLLGISTTILSNLAVAGDLIEEVRRNFDREVRIVVGGGAFGADPKVWRDLGAHGYGRDLRDACHVADQLLPRSTGTVAPG